MAASSLHFLDFKTGKQEEQFLSPKYYYTSLCVCVCVCVYTHAQLVPQLEWVAIPPPGDLPNPGIEPTPPVSAVLQADSLPAAPHWFSLNLMFILESDQTPVRIKAENLESSAGS